MKTILVATDFSGRSDLAVTRVARRAARTRAPLHLVHVADYDQSRSKRDVPVILRRRHD